MANRVERASPPTNFGRLPYRLKFMAGYFPASFAALLNFFITRSRFSFDR
jgi:hypothetical protein